MKFAPKFVMLALMVGSSGCISGLFPPTVNDHGADTLLSPSERYPLELQSSDAELGIFPFDPMPVVDPDSPVASGFRASYVRLADEAIPLKPLTQLSEQVSLWQEAQEQLLWLRNDSIHDQGPLRRAGELMEQAFIDVVLTNTTSYPAEISTEELDSLKQVVDEELTQSLSATQQTRRDEGKAMAAFQLLFGFKLYDQSVGVLDQNASQEVLAQSAIGFARAWSQAVKAGYWARAPVGSVPVFSPEPACVDAVEETILVVAGAANVVRSDAYSRQVEQAFGVHPYLVSRAREWSWPSIEIEAHLYLFESVMMWHLLKTPPVVQEDAFVNNWAFSRAKADTPLKTSEYVRLTEAWEVTHASKNHPAFDEAPGELDGYAAFLGPYLMEVTSRVRDDAASGAMSSCAFALTAFAEAHGPRG